jgi:hypothetical protein
MKKVLKKILLVLLFIFIGIQFIRPARNTQEGISQNDISKKFAVPADVEQVLQVTCNDCHSNNTRYPWYMNVQPVAWWLDDHIREGKQELNFSEFSIYSIRKQFFKLKKIKEEVEEGDMPLSSYTWIHKDAVLDSSKKKLLTNWADSLMAQMKRTYPPDSLKSKPRPPKNG